MIDKDKFNVIFECVAGSYLYGTNTPESDKDIRGIFIPPKEYFLGFLHRIEQIEEHKQDIVHYDIRKFLDLAVQCNPNIVELLFVPELMSTVWSYKWQRIIDNRSLFLSKKSQIHICWVCYCSVAPDKTAS